MITAASARELAEAWGQQCGYCDAGLPMNCTHPAEDPRAVISDLAEAVIAQAEQLERVRAMHVKDRDGWCQACAFAHPCPTARAVRTQP